MPKADGRADKQRNKVQTEELVYTTAVRMIAARGFHGTALRDVASEASLQTASLYYYFASKQAMLLSIMRRTMSAMHATTATAIADADDSPTSRLTAAVTAHVVFHGRFWQENIVTDSELRALEPEGRKEIVGLRDRYQQMFIDTLTDGLSSGEFSFDDVHVTTVAIITMCTAVSTWYRPSGRYTLEEVARQYSSMALRAVGANAPALPPAAAVQR